MIGPLQKNKAKYVAKHAYMWHSLCDIETAQAVAKHVEGRVLPVLIQVNISGESQKQGVVPQALGALYEELAHIKVFQVVGLMGMAAKDVDAQPAFALLRECGKELESSCSTAAQLELCMGMSCDWQLAIEEGATMIRVGTDIFGKEAG
ncbi:MAG: alanine racemase, partial [Ghiorsea sp.]